MTSDPSSTWPSLAEARRALTEGTGRGVRIAVLDSGIEAAHPRMNGLSLRDDLAVVVDGIALRIIPGKAHDLYGHGTAIAGILRALAPDAELGSFRVLGPHLRSRTAIIREGVRLALERDYHILNCSFGCARDDQVLIYKDWIDEAYLLGRHIVAACNNEDFTRREWPGHFPTVVTVNAARADRPETLYYRPGTLVEFSARGHDLEVAWVGGGVKRVTGSSFAAPHAAGLLARLLSVFAELPPLQAKALLQQLAEPWPAVAGEAG